MPLLKLGTLPGKVALFSICILVMGGGYLAFNASKEINILDSARTFVSNFSVPRVSGANFSLDYRKIPTTAKSIEITVSDPLDPQSVNTTNVRVNPAVSGSVSLRDANTIVYSLEKPLEEGEEYEISLGTGILSMGGKAIQGTTDFSFHVIPEVAVMNIFPHSSLSGGKVVGTSEYIENLNQNIVVIFNAPMIPLSNLERMKDQSPCPLDTSPKIEGTCHWLNGSTLELIPHEPLQGATRYTLTVSDTPGFLYPLSRTATGVFVTTPLSISVQSDFDPREGIIIRANAPIEKKSLESAITVYQKITEIGKQGVDIAIPIMIEPRKNMSGSISDREFIIQRSTGSFLYGESFHVRIKKGVSPKYGTEPLGDDITKDIVAREYLQSVNVMRLIRDTSGTVIDMKNVFPDPLYRVPPPFLPNSGALFHMTFHEEISLDPSLFLLRAVSGKNVEFSINYHEVSDPVTPTKKTIVKHKVDLIPKTPLFPNTEYEIILKKSANPELKEDVVKSYKTAPSIELSMGKILSNSEICLYSNVSLEENQQEQFTTNPQSPIREFTLDETIRWSYEESKEITEHRCEVREGMYAYIVGAHLEPKKQYRLFVGSGLIDSYGNTLGRDVSYSFMSVEGQMKDRFLYSSFTHFIQMIPTEIPIVINFLSYNTERVSVSVCSMNALQFIEYESVYFPRTEKCTKTYTRELPLKNNYWNVSANKFNLAEDIMREKMNESFYLVKAKIPGFEEKSGEYSDAKEVSHLFIRSNLVLTLEKSESGALLFASSLDGKELPNDLTFDIYRLKVYEGGSSQLTLKPEWIQEKKLYRIPELPYDGFIIIARNEKFFGVLNSRQDQAWNYDFKYISGQDSMERDYLYLYTDRPLYKVGETVFVKGILRHFSPTGYIISPEKKGKLMIFDDGGTMLYETGVTLDKNSNFDLSFSLPKDMKLGQYHFSFFTGENENTTLVYTNGEFHVDAYKKPVFMLGATMSDTESMLGGTGNVSISAEYYFGGKLTGADYTATILSQLYYFDAKEYGQYQFGEGYDYFSCLYWGSCTYNDQLVTSMSGVLDDQGKASIAYTYPHTASGTDTSGEKIYSYTMQVRDPDTQKTVSETVSQVVHTTDGYVGIRVPYWSKPDAITIDGVVLDYLAKGLAGKEVRIELWKREYKDVRKQGVDGFFYQENEVEKRKEKEILLTSNANGEFSTVLKSATGGAYEIRAHYTGKNGETFTSISEVYIDTDASMYWYEGNNSITDLTADSPIVQVGDLAHLTLKSPVSSGKMWISIEKDDAILESFVRDITSTTERIDVNITENFIPNIYVKVFLVGKKPGEKLPTYKRALSVMKVVSDPKKLSVALTPEKNRYLPGEPVKLAVSVTDAEGKGVPNANGSIAVVDESLLALMGNPLKNPFAFFYDMKRYLGVKTYTSLTNLIEKLEVKDLSSGEKGGAGEGQKGGLSNKKRGTFKDTAYWIANYTTDANGKAIIITDALPDNLTTWVIESIVSTTGGNKIGIGRASVQTTKAVIINENLPRFLGSNDRVILAPVIFNQTDRPQNFEVSLTGTMISLVEPTKTVWIGTGESALVPFTITVNQPAHQDSSPVSVLTLRATAKETHDQDEVVSTLPIMLTVTPETVATVGQVKGKSQNETISLESSLRAYSGELTMHFATTLLPNLLSSMKFLESFSYGCAEQNTSAILSSLLLQHLGNRLGTPHDLTKEMVRVYKNSSEGYTTKSIDTIIREYLVDIRAFQRPDGGFGFWEDSRESDEQLSATLLSAFADMRILGYEVDRSLIEKAVSFVKQKFYQNSRIFCLPSLNNCGYTVGERMHMIEAVIDIEPNDYEAYKMYKLLVFSGGLETIFPSDHGILLTKLKGISSLVQTEREIIAQKVKTIIETTLSNNLVSTPRGAYIRSGDRIESTARFIELVTRAGYTKEYEQIIPQMERWILSQKHTDGSFGSTLTTARVLRSLFSSITKPRDITAQGYIDGMEIFHGKFTGSGLMQTLTKTIPLSELRDKSVLRFEKDGSGILYYDISLTYNIPTKSIMSKDEGFFVSTEYYDYEEYKRIESLKQEEWRKYMSGELDEKDLQYSREITEYLKPLESLTVGKLVYVKNQIITGEYRSQVAFEGFIPAGSELVNPNLATEDQNIKESIDQRDSMRNGYYEQLFDHTEWRDDRYFATTRSMSPGVHTFSYILRPTHSGMYHLRPTRVFEFYHPETFGRTGGKQVMIMK